MNYLDSLNFKNFETSFNLKELLKNSAFYPASGTDGSHLKKLFEVGICSFIHVDYSIKRLEVKNRLNNDFKKLGYVQIGMKLITPNELTTFGTQPVLQIPFNKHEISRTENKPFTLKIQPFAYWTVYELDSTKTGKTMGKAKRFSILHIGGEGCATFDALYLQNKINPKAMVIIRSGEGYGDNWTLFTDPQFRLHKMLEYNILKHNEVMPKYLITMGFPNNTNPKPSWPNYNFLDKFYEDDYFYDFFSYQHTF